MKALTETGKNFIRTICSGSSTSLISGKYEYNLPFSNLQDQNVTFTANAVGADGNLILTNEQLGESLIIWYDRYAELNDFDANVLAAQGYEESRYRLWNYGRRDSGSGISDFISKRVYRQIVNSRRPDNFEQAASPEFTDDEINKIIFNLTGATNEQNYLYRGKGSNSDSINIAVNNRVQLFQNIINNPEIMIKAQAGIMREIAERNNGNTAASLFAYDRGYLLFGTIDSGYSGVLDKAGRKYGERYAQLGIQYVDRVFGYLSDENNDKSTQRLDKPKGLWFGIETDFTVDRFTAALG